MGIQCLLAHSSDLAVATGEHLLGRVTGEPAVMLSDRPMMRNGCPCVPIDALAVAACSAVVVLSAICTTDNA